MEHASYDRRKFNELSAAALGGLIAGTLAGCGGGEKKEEKKVAAAPDATSGEKHLCRGLNECKSQGISGTNECRGQGDCATFAKHSCHAENDCKGQGGCGKTPGLNDCKGKGDCSVPLMTSAWKIVRERKKTAWTEAGEKFGDPPPKKS